MPIGVINFLEVIQIEINDTHLRLASRGNSMINKFMNSIAIGQAGDGVCIRQYA
ncbi:Uncharacterised protein [Salmonella enterica subsp. enterica serovar Bovismorbificans]|nr:Uncharacterised protein [Salmonella enterica subsp. enterica serovar Bovismorbificans]